MEGEKFQASNGSNGEQQMKLHWNACISSCATWFLTGRRLYQSMALFLENPTLRRASRDFLPPILSARKAGAGPGLL